MPEAVRRGTAARAQEYLTAALTRHNQGHVEAAEDLYRRSLRLEPQNPDALHLLGVLHAQQQDFATAISLIAHAIALHPDSALFHHNLGNAFFDSGYPAAAATCHGDALRLDPTLDSAWFGRGRAAAILGRLDRAISCFTQAQALNPASDEVASHLGATLRGIGQPESALRALAQAVVLAPASAQHRFNLGMMQMDLHRLDAALADLRAAVAMAPEDARLHYGLAFCLLMRGDWREGFQEYAWRWRAPDFTTARRPFPCPAWTGQPLPEATVLVHAEQGFGDTLQFARYIPRVAARVGRVLVEVPPELLRLMRDSLTEPNITVIPTTTAGLPDCAAHAPIGDLPLLCGTVDTATLPADIPYLRANSQRIADWQRRLVALTADTPTQRRVGLVWAGRPSHPNDTQRSLTLAQWAPLATVPDTLFVALQQGAAAAQTPPAGLALRPLLPPDADFADTAALICALDLVIAVDTAPLHLAAALGVPTWGLLPYSGDWRWQLDRTDSPWYPQLRLFRQPRWGDWPAVLHAVAAALTENGRTAG